LTLEEVEQIFCARREMEGLAAELAAKRITDEDLACLERCLENMRSAAIHNRLHDFCLFDIEYHLTIWRLSGNRFLAAALETMVVPLFAFFNMTCPPDNAETLLESVEQHAQVIRAFRKGKAVRSEMVKAIDYFRTEKCKLLFNKDGRGSSRAK
jgi:DNA-binding GntR family transcriptional regulator